jgi:hypothetical protein
VPDTQLGRRPTLYEYPAETRDGLAISPPIFWGAGTKVIPSCYYSTDYVAPDSHDEQ